MDGASEPRVLTEDMLAGPREFERGMSLTPPVTLALMGACLVVHARILALPTAFVEEAVLRGAGNAPERVAAGEWSRLASSVFVHASFEHLAGNLAALYVLGVGCEHAFGPARTFAAFILAGLAGSLASCATPGLSVGASGGIFGLLGLLAAALWEAGDRIVLRERRIPVVLLTWAGFAFVQGALEPYIDNLAHLGGFLAGLALGLKFEPMKRDADGPALAALLFAVPACAAGARRLAAALL